MAVPIFRFPARPSRLRPVPLLFCAGLSLAAAAGAAPPPAPQSSPQASVLAAAQSAPQIAVPGSAGRVAAVDAQLLRRFAQRPRQDYLVELRERADLSAAEGMDWQQRGRFVYQTLRDTAERSQAALRRSLRADGLRFEAFWIKNAIVVRSGDLASAEKLSRRSDVQRIALLPRAEPGKPELQRSAPATHGVASNIQWVGADQVWAQGTNGNGVTVGIVDTGVELEHEALRQQYRGALPGGGYAHDYNWFDPLDFSPAPRDLGGHGTHVAGTAVGDNRQADPALRERIGMAPGAQWIACQGFPLEGDPAMALLACGQFMLAPSRRDGSDPDPDRRPQVVNNSWSSYDSCDGQPRPFFQDMVEAWAAAGVIPLFAQGNASNCDLPEPAGLGTVPSPASLAAAFAVGSTGNHDGEYAYHSVWGPTAAIGGGSGLPDPHGFPQLKPQVVAPGVAIRSSTGGGYALMTGTSMSSPHVAGLIALMLEAGECLRGDYPAIGGLIMRTARPLPYDSGGTPPPGPGNVPNYATGWGEIDAPAAVNAAAAACGPQGFLRGRLTSAGGAAIAGAIIDVQADTGGRSYRLVSDVDGSFVRRLPAQTSTGYRIRVSAYGYLPDSETGVLVYNGMDTTHNVTLATAPLHKISGIVTDAATGWPLHARIRISGYPGDAQWTDPQTGRYALRLPAGSAYRFDVDSDVPGYIAASRDLADAGAAATHDFALAADRVTCTAPGYAFSSQLLGEDFESAPPAGWTRSSSGIGWQFGDSGELSTFVYAIPAHGRFAASNETLGADTGWGNDGRFDYLVSPPLDFSSASTPVLHYASHYQTASGGARVQGSRDGGASWITLGRPQAQEYNVGGWGHEAVDLAALAGAADVRLRFHADDGGDGVEASLGPSWAIDDVQVSNACSPPSQGGLLIGHVRDANTGAPLDGAEVQVGNNTFVYSFASADPGVGAGFYATYAGSGAASLRAGRGSLPAGYGEVQQSIAVATGSTQVADLQLPAARLRLYPGSGPAATVTLGSTASAPFTVRNTGTAPLQFGFEGVALEEHFEAAFPPPGWSVVTHSNDCGWAPLHNLANYAAGDGNAAAVGLLDCSDTEQITDTELRLPALNLAGSHTASMGFFVSLFNTGLNFPRLDVDASTDGGNSWQTIWTRSEDLSSSGPGALVELDLTAFAGTPELRLRVRFSAMPPYGWAIVDQMHLFNGVSASDSLDLSPEHGQLAAGASQELQATFDARHIAQPGVYSVPVRVVEDTPYEWPFGDVYATMTVLAPASHGAVTGRVQSLGACDIHPATLPGAQVAIQDAAGASYSTQTDADGNFRYWLPASAGPFTLQVQAEEHAAAAPRSFSLSAGAETRADVDLRPLLPCLLSSQAALQASVATGQSTSLGFQLMNGGAAATSWSLRSGGDPAVLLPLALSQTATPDPKPGYSTACIVPPTNQTLENEFLRVFPLGEREDPAQIATVTGLRFAIDTARSGSGTQGIKARVYKLNGELNFANMQLLREQDVSIADGDLQRLAVQFGEPLIVARDTVLVASLYVPSGVGLGNVFYPGFNDSAQSRTGYMASDSCGQDQPTAFADIDPRLASLALLLELEVLGSEPCGAAATPAPWLGVNPGSGSLAAAASADVQAQFAGAGLSAGRHAGSLCLGGADAARPQVIPVTLQVGGSDAIFADGFQ